MITRRNLFIFIVLIAVPEVLLGQAVPPPMPPPPPPGLSIAEYEYFLLTIGFLFGIKEVIKEKEYIE